MLIASFPFGDSEVFCTPPPQGLGQPIFRKKFDDSVIYGNFATDEPPAHNQRRKKRFLSRLRPVKINRTYGHCRHCEESLCPLKRAVGLADDEDYASSPEDGRGHGKCRQLQRRNSET